MSFLNTKKGGIVPKEIVSLKRRLDNIEEKLSKCECNNKFKHGDSVKFIYENSIRDGEVVSKTPNEDLYCIFSCGLSYEVSEKQIAYKK